MTTHTLGMVQFPLLGLAAQVRDWRHVFSPVFSPIWQKGTSFLSRLSPLRQCRRSPRFDVRQAADVLCGGWAGGAGGVTRWGHSVGACRPSQRLPVDAAPVSPTDDRTERLWKGWWRIRNAVQVAVVCALELKGSLCGAPRSIWHFSTTANQLI